MRDSYKRNGTGWTGVIKDGKKTVWTCPHIHRNRDFSGSHAVQHLGVLGYAARECAYMEIKARNN
jgi:hypothetical protein